MPGSASARRMKPWLANPGPARRGATSCSTRDACGNDGTLRRRCCRPIATNAPRMPASIGRNNKHCQVDAPGRRLGRWLLRWFRLMKEPTTSRSDRLFSRSVGACWLPPEGSVDVRGKETKRNGLERVAEAQSSSNSGSQGELVHERVVDSEHGSSAQAQGVASVAEVLD